MTPASRSLFLRLTSLALTLTFVVSCSSARVGDGATISKIKYYNLIPQQPLNVSDPAILFELQHHLYGAVTKAEVINRGGHYYTIFWKAEDRSQPVTVRFEYRQSSDGLVTRTKEVEIADIGRSNTTKFQVTGEEYKTLGRVTSWRITLLRGKQELVSQTSYLWN